MDELRPAPGAGDRVDSALDDLRRSYAADQPPSTLEDRIVQRVRLMPQARPARPALVWGTPYGLHALRRSVGVATTAIAAVVFVVILGGNLIVSGLRPATSQPASAPASGMATGASGAARPAAAPSTSGAPAVGTCPVTAITRIVGGTAPEVDVSGLRWRWGTVPWVAGHEEKVVWLEDAGRPSAVDLSLFAVRLDRSVARGGAAVTYAGSSDRSILAAGEGNVQGVVIPSPGCWLLTAVWSGGASSVVVAVSPPPPTSGGSDSAAPSPMPSTAVPPGPLAACPTTARSTDAGPQGWPGPAYVDGDFRWLTPSAAAWRIGGDGDKLVLDTAAGWDIGRMAIEAMPLVGPSRVGWLGRDAVDGDTPPGFGGGTLGFGLTLPSRGCWAIAYAGSQATSTIVVDLGR